MKCIGNDKFHFDYIKSGNEYEIVKCFRFSAYRWREVVMNEIYLEIFESLLKSKNNANSLQNMR